MKDIYEALVLAFDADNDLSTMFPRGLFNDVGFDAEGLPVCIISGISEVSSWTTCDEINDLRVQFSVYSTTDTQCFDAIAFLKAEFDDITFALSNASLIRVTRIGGIPPRKVDNAWRGVIDYRIETQI